MSHHRDLEPVGFASSGEPVLVSPQALEALRQAAQFGASKRAALRRAAALELAKASPPVLPVADEVVPYVDRDPDADE